MSEIIVISNPASFRDEARWQRVCAVCGRAHGRPDYRGETWHAHHVIAKAELKKRGLPLYDTRGALRLCTDCHMSSEWGGVNRVEIPLVKLTDENIGYVFMVMEGAAGCAYLRKHYAGDDWRVDKLEALCQS